MIEPTADFVLLEEIETPSTAPGGLIHIPDTAKQKFNNGTVISSGPDAITNLEPGTIAVFPLHSEYRVEHKSKRYILVRESEIMARNPRR